MKKEDVSQIISHIDEKYLNEATMFALESDREATPQHNTVSKKTEKQIHWLKWCAMAACLVLIVASGSTALVVMAETREYKKAVAFFDKNGLSTEGLSRSEVKSVYRDITEKKFSYGKTAEVIQQAVPGWEISQHEPTPEELAALWDKNIRMNPIPEKGISYCKDSRYVFDEKRGFKVLEKDILECYQDGKILWSTEFKDFYIDDYAYTKEGTVIYGKSETFSPSDISYGWIAIVDGAGSIVWQKRLEHGFQTEYVAAVLANGDGTWAVFSRGDVRYVCLSCYDADGKELSFHKTEVGLYGIRNVARLGDSYIIQLWNQSFGATALLYKMDREGNLTDSFLYEEDDFDYYITDMIEYEGQIYLSAYAVPKRKAEGGRDEIALILDYISSREDKGRDLSDEELTPIVRDNYTAMLLICDPEGGSPKTFYSVKGSLGSDLSVNTSEQLEWNVESITTTFFSPFTSAYTIGGNCAVFCYTFDAEGNLTGQTDTGNTTLYRR